MIGGSGCGHSQLPEFTKRGIDMVGCVAPNDPYAVQAWADKMGVDTSKVRTRLVPSPPLAPAWPLQLVRPSSTSRWCWECRSACRRTSDRRMAFWGVSFGEATRWVWSGTDVGGATRDERYE
jgi:hypothetical protein